MSETRKLAAILVADVVGYWRLAGRDQERTLARLSALRSDLIDPAVAAHHGRVVKRTGDGSIVEFRSVVDAVRCAIEVQNGLVERNVGARARQPHRISNWHPSRRRGRRGDGASWETASISPHGSRASLSPVGCVFQRTRIGRYEKS